MILKKIGKFALLFTISTMLLTGCSNNSNNIASISGYSVDKETLTNEVNLYRAIIKLTSEENLSTEDIEKYAEMIADKLTYIEMLYKEGTKTGLEASEEELNYELNLINEVIDKTEGLREILEMYGYNKEAIQESVKKSLIASSYQQDLSDDLAVSNNDVKDFYEENKDELYTYPSVDAAHILIKTFSTDSDGSEIEFNKEEKAKAKEKAKTILDRINKGEDFNKLAKELSEDEGSKENGGELGTFFEGDMVKEFEEAAFSLKEGEVSDIVETKFGYHIIKVNSNGPSALPFERISPDVRQDALNSLFDEKISALEKKYNFKLNKDNISSVVKDLKPIKLPETNSDKKADNTKKEEK